ncbi:hypothetical protein ABZO31_01155 [Streptomyces sp. HUAS MG47]|uniref:hypothetical protein n=1 Tax=Streptomyces solicamelliae TaxID=3231716 RepID=UPI003877A089
MNQPTPPRRLFRRPTIIAALAALAAPLLLLSATSPVTAAGEGRALEARLADTRVTVKSGWELARIRANARSDAEIVGEMRPGQSHMCSVAGCPTVVGHSITACGVTDDQWFAIWFDHGDETVAYVSRSCAQSQP